MAKIKLYSKQTFRAFGDIKYENKTNPALEAIHGKKIIPTWQNENVLIKAGEGEYDDFILEWASIKTAITSGTCYLLATEEPKKEVVEETETKKTKRTRKVKEEVEEDSLADLAE